MDARIRRDQAFRARLTERQREVAELVARGLTNAQIADELQITLDGVKWHVREILSKLGLNSRLEIAEWWRTQRGIPVRLRHRIATVGALKAVVGVAAASGIGVLVVAAALGLSGDDDPSIASVASSPTASGTHPADDPNSPLALWGRPDATEYWYRLALATGVLIRQGKCLYIQRGSERTFVAFHALNTTWDESRQTLKVDDWEYKVGGRIALGGGHVNDRLKSMDPTWWYAPPDPSCDLSDGFVAGEGVDPDYYKQGSQRPGPLPTPTS